MGFMIEIEREIIDNNSEFAEYAEYMESMNPIYHTVGEEFAEFVAQSDQNESFYSHVPFIATRTNQCFPVRLSRTGQARKICPFACPLKFFKT
jgi:hypothetical protein